MSFSTRIIARSLITARPRIARQFSTNATSQKKSSFPTIAVAALVAAGGVGYAYSQDNTLFGLLKAQKKRPLDYQEVYNAIASTLDDNDYDDGSYGPVFLRLAWHAAGTYDKNTNTGGSNGATMRFEPESGHGANAGLKIARDRLEPVKAKFPEISYSDLWSLAGVVAVQEMGGPTIPWRPGRTDAVNEQSCTPDGRLPDAAQGERHVRAIFGRMGFNDQEMTALLGAHALGRCHTDRSGYSGPWTRSPTVFTNDYYQRLLEEKWQVKKWNGPKQFEDKATKELMMLPGDMAFLNDKGFRKWVEVYAKDSDKFFKDFAHAFQKLEELGVPFKPDTPVYNFKVTE